jgi:uncharacterized protein YndB with AHSA1/START domain
MKIAFMLVTAVGVLLVAALLGAGVRGALLPRRHHVTRVASYAQPPDSVWAAIADFEHSPKWRSDIVGAQRLPDHNGHPVWLQIQSDGRWPLELTEVEPPKHLVAVVADSSHGFGGAWTYALEPTGGGTRVAITEDGFVDNPFFRFMAHDLFGLDATLDDYLRGLGRHFGENVTPAAR